MCVFTLRCVHELCMFCSALVSAGGSSFTFWSPSAILTRPQKTCLIYIIWGALQQNWRKTDADERTHAVTARCWVYCSALCAALSKSPQEDRGSFLRCSLAAAFFQNWFISVLMLLSAIGTLNCGTVPTTANSHGTLKKNTSILLDHVLCNMFVSLCKRLLIDYLFCLLIFLIYCGCCLLKPVSASCFILWTAALHESWYIYTVVVVDMVVMSTSLQWQRGTQTRGLRLLSITDQLCGVSWLQSLSTVHLRAVWSGTASLCTLTLQTEVAARWQRLFSVYECWRSYLCVRRAIHSLTFAVSGALSLCTDLTHAPRLRQELTPSLAALSTFLHQTGATTPDFQLKAPWESLQKVLRS